MSDRAHFWLATVGAVVVGLVAPDLPTVALGVVAWNMFLTCQEYPEHNVVGNGCRVAANAPDCVLRKKKGGRTMKK